MTASTPTTRPLEHGDFPGLFQAADEQSVRSQQRHLRAVRARLLLAGLAAVSGAATLTAGPADLAALCTALFFVGALGADVLMLRTQSDKGWYQGRALAESAKTLAWRYAVGGAPFPRTLPYGQADQLFAERLGNLRRDFESVSLLPSPAEAITPRMRELRSAPLAERRETYLNHRTNEQKSWYAGKAVFHRRRADLFQRLVLACEVLGVAAALARAVHAVPFDLAGILAAAVSGLAAWNSARQHGSTAEAYTTATHDLDLAQLQLHHPDDEPGWASAVADAESAISREHSTWRSSHGSPGPARGRGVADA